MSDDASPDNKISEFKKIGNIISEGSHIVIVQADNPDADSLASALALEQILEEHGKKTSLYCGVDMPGYLKYLSGWDRVSPQLPSDFDVSIIVDTSAMSLLEKLTESGNINRLKTKKSIVIDHHKETDNDIDFADIVLLDSTKSSTGDIIYHLAKNCSWPLDKISAGLIMTSILGDTQGLTNEHAGAETYRTMAELIELGVERSVLEEARRELSKMARDIFLYKADLIKRTEFYNEGKIALVTIPQEDITNYSPLYNPNALIQTEHLQTIGVEVSIAIKHYADGKITGSIRSGIASPVASKVAESLGGGGHDNASGFKITDGRDIEEIKRSCIAATINALEKLQ